MKKAGYVVMSVFAGIVIYSSIMGFAEANQMYFALLPMVALGVSILLAYRLYIYLYRKSAPLVMSAVTEPKSEPELWFLYALFVMQIILSMGYANEFSDHVVAFGITAIFFIIEILLIYRAIRKRGATIYISILLFLAAFQLLAFLTDNEAISDKYPAEQYYETFSLVVWMLVGTVVLEVIKLATLHRDKLRHLLRHRI